MGEPSRRRRSGVSPGIVAIVSAAVVAAFLVLVGSASAPAFAKRKGARHGSGTPATSGKRVTMMPADGSDGAERPVRAKIRKALTKNKIKVAGKPRASAPSDDQGWMALARTLKVDGFIVPSYQGDKSQRSVEIAVRTASDGSVVKSATFTAKGAPRKLAAAVGKGFWKELGSAIEQVSAPAAGQEGTGMPARDLSHDTADASERTKTAAEGDGSDPAPQSTPPATDSSPVPVPDDDVAGAAAEGKADDRTPEAKLEDEAATKPRPPPAAVRSASGGAASGSVGPKLPAVALRLAVRFVSRSVSYTANPALPTSTLTSPTLGGAASWFPITYLGLEVAGELASWLKYADKYPGITSELTGSLVFRWPLSFGELTAHAGAFRHMLALQDDDSHTRVDQPLPDLVYVGARAGAGLSYHLTDAFTAAAAASYRLITNMNGGAYGIKSGEYFPSAVPGPGLDLALTLAYRITALIEVQAGFDMRRYVLSARGASGTRFPATYLTDQSLAGWVGVGVVFGGH